MLLKILHPLRHLFEQMSNYGEIWRVDRRLCAEHVTMVKMVSVSVAQSHRLLEIKKTYLNARKVHKHNKQLDNTQYHLLYSNECLF
jgi:hypothetical protein